LYQRLREAEALFGHIFGDAAGHMVTFTGRQARLERDDARPNELCDVAQRSFPYPSRAEKAASYLLAESQRWRDVYYGVHLFRKPGNRLAANAAPTVGALWLDEDEGSYPEAGPAPTAVVSSSAERRHLYWRLTQEVSVEWAVSMNRRLAVWAAGDVGKAGLATVLRVPGTMNYKRHPRLDPVTMELTSEAPDAWDPEVLEQAVPEISSPSSTPASSSGPYEGPELELQEFLDGVEVLGEVADGLGTKLAIICPWLHEHSGGDRTGTYVGHRAGGGFWYACHHEHCQGRRWREFKRAVLAKAKAKARNRTITVEMPGKPEGCPGPTLRAEIRYE
jgi:hypothetical protein